MKTSFAVAAGAVAASLMFVTTDANAWWQRHPASECRGLPNSSGGSTVLYSFDGSIEVIGASSGLGFFVSCPFVDSDTTKDNSITGITVDLFNPTTSTEPSGSLQAWVCSYSNWTDTCSPSQDNSPVIYAGGHASLNISSSNLAPWTNDSGNGYASVVLFEMNNYTNYVAGIYYH